MSFDNSRFTFNPWNDYCGVVMEQGRVQLDSDWNEWLAELSRRIQAGTLDVLGRAAYPATTPFAFHVTAASSGGKNTISIGPGRMYVDGLLAENHGVPASAQWDPALAEMSGSPQPPPATETDTIDFTSQPHLPNAAIPEGDGPFLAYLDVWIRPITYLEDPNLVDRAVGVDTTGRLQTVWQVKLLPVPAGTTCSTPDSSIPWPAASAGQLTTGTVASAPSGPCCLNSSTGYTGLENQFYRLEIHREGKAATTNTYPLPTGSTTATFKFSRDNASVATLATGIVGVTNSVGKAASQLTVQSMGRDQVLGFAPGNWIEILDDNLELNGQPGELHQIDSIDFSAKTITLDAPVNNTSFPVDGNNQTTASRHTRIRRWDQGGKVFQSDNTTLWVDLGVAGSTGDIPVPPPGTTLILENGITVTFNVSITDGTFQTGDFWTFAARTDGSLDTLTQAPPRGIHHHYARLSVVTFDPPSATDCRTKWPPSGGTEECGCCCTCTVGDGQESVGQFSSIQEAINSLPASGGEVCILPGRYFEHVLIEGRENVVVHGCGWQTRLASPMLKPGGSPAADGGDAAEGTGTASANVFNAVISITSSRHVVLRSFAVEAAQDEVGILVDGTGELIANPGGSPETPAADPAETKTHVLIAEFGTVTDVTIEDTVLTGSTLPAIMAVGARLLKIDENRIAMQDVESLWPAVYVSGTEIHVDRNWVGLQTGANRFEWLPSTVTDDLDSDKQENPEMAEEVLNLSAKHPGGIQIAGPSRDVFVLENEIEGGSRNGITLGSFEIVDQNGEPTGQIVGVLTGPEGPCSTSGTLQVSGTTPGQEGTTTAVAGGPLLRIQIHRNRIRNMGLCGIGPAGFFDLSKIFEVITIKELDLTGNVILSTLKRSIDTTTIGNENATFGYGAICVPDVEGLIIRDNTITDFGNVAGADVCGIFILHGQMVEISRNQVLETRDWKHADPAESKTGTQVAGGIVLLMVTPPAFSGSYNAQDDASLSQIYQPGMPALRVMENVVRVPLPFALFAFGLGPFAIGNNHFTCGGSVKSPGFKLAQTVCIFNLGAALELAGAMKTPTGLSNQAKSGSFTMESTTPSSASSGAVVFTGNVCQLEQQIEGGSTLASVLIITLDHLIFANNHLWLAADRLRTITDALLLAGSLQVTSNRFQETPFVVALSAWTLGFINVTSQNVSTHCIFAEAPMLLSNNNLALVQAGNKEVCGQFAGKQFNA